VFMGLIRIVLLVMAFIGGLASAYSLSQGDSDDEETAEFDQMLTVMGVGNLSGKKNALYKLLNVSLVISFPYAILSLIYFYGATVPFVLGIIFIIIQLLSYFSLRRRIAQTEDIKSLVLIGTFDNMMQFFEMSILAIHIGYLFQI